MALSPPTPNLGLVVWAQDQDVYNHAELYNNWLKLDQHDHTPGKGNRITTAALADYLVTGIKLAPDSVTPDKIPDNSIGQNELAPNSVGSSELQDDSVDSAAIQPGAIGPEHLSDAAKLPLGIVTAWYRLDSSVPVPYGWIVAAGQPWSAVQNDLGATSGNVPDLRNRFILGAAENGTGSGPDSPPPVGYASGSNSVDVSHSHSVPAHTHTVSSHAHGIAIQAEHTHRFWSHNYDSGGVANSYLTHANQREVGVSTSAGARQVMYIPNLNINNAEGPNVVAPMGPAEYAGGVQHNHGGQTGGSGTLTTNATASLTDSVNTVVDTRGRFIGLLYIIKVKN